MLTIEDVDNITPLPRAIIHSLAARVAVKTPLTFKSITLSNVSSVYCVKGVLSEIPALLTKISTQPYVDVASRKASLTDSRLERSGLIPEFLLKCCSLML